MALHSDVLYYEVLDFSITELENKQQLRVTWMTAQTMLGVWKTEHTETEHTERDERRGDTEKTPTKAREM